MSNSATATNQAYVADVPQRSKNENPQPVLSHPVVAARYDAEGTYGLGETYIEGLWSVDNLDEFMFSVFQSPKATQRGLKAIPVLKYLVSNFVTNPQKGKGAYHIGKVHYGLGNKLFEKMLGKTMTYTCGYWRKAKTLDEAQTEKLDLLCRKLKLEPGMKVLDIGCGWGNFAKYAAKNYGVSVTGITVSEEQAGFAKKFCEGLPVEILIQDYRDTQGKYDRIVSIEMIEAVGKKNLRTYFETVHRLLKDNGLFALESITGETFSTKSPLFLDQYVLWIVKHIFPRGYLPKIKELANPCSDLFVLQDWHGFSGDYDRTLLEWGKNFNESWDEIKDEYGEPFRRKWNFYLYGCAALFRTEMVQLYQVVYSKGAFDKGGYIPER